MTPARAAMARGRQTGEPGSYDSDVDDDRETRCALRWRHCGVMVIDRMKFVHALSTPRPDDP